MLVGSISLLQTACETAGEDVGDPHDQEQDRQFVDQVLRRRAEFRQQHGGGQERKRLDAVLMGAERAGADRILIESRVARPGIVELRDNRSISPTRSSADTASVSRKRTIRRPSWFLPPAANTAKRTERGHCLDKDSATREATGIMTAVVPIGHAEPAPAAQPERVGVLLVNLGTPDTADARGVRVYLQANSCPIRA